MFQFICEPILFYFRFIGRGESSTEGIYGMLSSMHAHWSLVIASEEVLGDGSQVICIINGANVGVGGIEVVYVVISNHHSKVQGKLR